MKVDNTVKRETKYIAYFCVVLSLIMQALFILLKKWDYTVVLGNVLSVSVAVLNFFFMGLSVQKSLSMEQGDSKKLMKSSQGFRNAVVFVTAAVGAAAPCFNTIAVIIPLFFPRIAVSFRPFVKEKEVIRK